MATCEDISKYMNEIAPLSLAEEWDNAGLMIGGKSDTVKKIMVCLDVTSKVVKEAVEKNVDLIVSHHPLLFKPLKRILKDEFKGKILYELIKNNIAVYSAHTNLDVSDGGLNQYLAEYIGLKRIQNLNSYKNEKLYKVVVFVPEESLDGVRNAMCNAGAGWIGKYSDCTFSAVGTGTFRPREGANPYIGSLEELEKVKEYRLETVVPEGIINKVVNAMLNSHPYEEVAYDIYPLEIKGREFGLGKVGYVEPACTFNDFLSRLKKALDLDAVKVIGEKPEIVSKAAVFSGSFDGNCSGLHREKPDVLITGDIKHNNAIDLAEMGYCIIDAGHYATEIIVKELICNKLKNKFDDIEILKSEWENNPAEYC
jgi:dinuclear metal center YbgI/SA1388 family protein